MSVPLEEWTEKNKMARTLTELKETVSLQQKPNYGCIKPPLINLELDRIIPDELHMLLRITDVLIQNLINAATSHDCNRSGVTQSKVSIDIV